MSQKVVYHQVDFSGGLNDSASPIEIAQDEASVLQNWDITYKGQLKRRAGLTKKGDTIHATNPIRGLAPFLRTTGAKDILAIQNNDLYYLNSSTWTALDTSSFSGSNYYWMETCPNNNKLYISNEDNTTRSWDRASTTLNSCLTDLGNTKFQANVMRWHKNHMFFLNNLKVGATSYPNYMGWSAIGDPDTHDTTNDKISIPGDGRVITAIDLGDSLVIFKERAIQFLRGWGDTDWQITGSSSNVANIDERVGICGPRACTRVGNEVWFMDDEGNIRRLYQTDFDAYRRDIISNNIQGTLSGLNKAQLSKVIAWTWNDKVYFAVPSGSATENNLVLVYDIISARRTGKESWTTYTGWAPSLFCDYLTTSTPELYVGGNATGKVWIHTGNDDDGTAISARWDGFDSDYGDEGVDKIYKYGRISGNTTSSTASIAVYSSVDQTAFANLGNLELISTGEGLGPTGTFRLGPTGTSVLGGSGDIQNFQYFFSSGGGAILGKRVRMSLRTSNTGVQPVVNSFYNYFTKRKAN